MFLGWFLKAAFLVAGVEIALTSVVLSDTYNCTISSHNLYNNDTLAPSLLYEQ